MIISDDNVIIMIRDVFIVVCCSEGADSGIFTSSYHSEHEQDHTLRLSVSQSFGKSFPEINEDAKEEDGDLLAADLFPEDRMRSSRSFTAAPAPGPAPAKPKRSMVTSYSNISLSSPRAVQLQPAPGQGGTSSVRARVRMFESMSSSSARVAGTTKQSASLAPPPATSTTAVEKKDRRGGGGDVQRKQEQPSPAPIMSVSSSSSAASCGYKDFLIDDDYKDQQQIILGHDTDTTLKEKVSSFLSEPRDQEEERSDDDTSVRELLGETQQTSSVDTASEQDSILSETGSGAEEHTENRSGYRARVLKNIYTSYCSLRIIATTDIQSQEDIIQDVMDMNTLLCKLKNILMEVRWIYFINIPSNKNIFNFQIDMKIDLQIDSACRYFNAKKHVTVSVWCHGKSYF